MCAWLIQIHPGVPIKISMYNNGKCEHKYKTVGWKSDEENSNTLVLLECILCGVHYSEEIDGLWSKELGDQDRKSPF